MAWSFTRLRSRFRVALRTLALGARVALAGVLGRALPGAWGPSRGVPELEGARPGATIPGQEHHEQPARFPLAWTPPEIEGAVYSAQLGNLQSAADCISALRATDDRVGPVLSDRVLSTLGAPLTFEAAPAGRLRRRALRAAQLEEDFWEMCPERELEELYAWVAIMRIGLAELVWVEPDPADPTGEKMIARIRNGRNVPRLKVWNPRNLRKDSVTGQWLVRLRDGTEEVVRPGGGKWVLVLGGGPAPWLAAPWIGVANLWSMKWDAATDWAEQGERYANGILWVDTPDGSTPADRKELREQFRTAGHNPIVVGPPDHKGRILELKSAAWDTHRARWELCNRGITIALLCNDLATESKASAGTGANLQGDVRDDIKAADARQMETDLRAQVLGPWARANFGDPELAPWPALDVEPATDQQAIALTWKMLFDAFRIAGENNVPVDKLAIMEMFGIPSVEDLHVPLPALLGYHVTSGAFTVNDIRADRGRAPVAWGDLPPAPKTGPFGESKNDDKALARRKVDEGEAIEGEVEQLARTIGLRAALDTVAKMHGAPLTTAELRAIERHPATAAHELAALFGDRTAERCRAVQLAQARAARRRKAPPREEAMAA